MGVTYVQGNILNATTEAVVNTVNCVGVMGKGLALQFKENYPRVFNAYKKACDAGEVKPGKMHVVIVKKAPFEMVINFPTKRHWRDNSRMRDIEAGMATLVNDIKLLDIKSIAIPKLGCANGGLNWDDVLPVILDAVKAIPDVDVHIYGEKPVDRSAPLGKIMVVNKHHKTPYDAYIGRGSDWGNPFSHQDGTTAKFKVKTRDEAVLKHRKWLLKQPNLLMRLHELKGQVLCCYCDPAPCHGHTIADLVDNTFYLVIAGGRDFKDYDRLAKKADSLLRKVKRNIVIVSGRAPGADTLGEKYARSRGYEVAEFPADWKRDDRGNYDRRAGIKRNEQMADFAKSLRGGALLFHDGSSPGTNHMKGYCKKIGIQTFVESY